MDRSPDSSGTTAFMRFEYVPGSLDAKTRELVLLAAAAVAGCDH